MGLVNRKDLSLSGKRAVVCGSTDGIGEATAYKLAEQYIGFISNYQEIHLDHVLY